MKICAYCGQQQDDDARFCTGCGANQFKPKCPNCGNVFEGGNFCPQCGVRAGRKERTCPQCGEKYFSNACPNCGYIPNRSSGGERSGPININFTSNTVSQPAPDRLPASGPEKLPASPPKGQPKDKIVALILCILFGYWGMHKFYEGKTAMGVVYIFTFGLFMIGWFVDILVLIGKPNPYYVQ